jgi:signal transduction histidine kinase
MQANLTCILNVDDNDPARYIKSRELRQAGFTVVEAKTGAEALRLAEQNKVSVALLDVKLPDINGFEVCRYIKEKWPGVMVLMTSATFTTATDRTLGLDAGADTYLIQPAEPLELIASVNALLRIRRTEDQLRTLNDTLDQRVKDRTSELAAANFQLKEEIEQRLKAEAALVQSQKMEAVGQLTGGLAHDFNNLLTAVLGNIELIRVRSADSRVQRWANNAFRAAQRGSRLTSQLLAFSRTQKLATAPIDVNSLILGMHELLDQSLGANVLVKTDLAPALPAAMADPNQLELAILNLAINARDAMPEGGAIAITTALAPDDANAIMIAVADTGTGMPPDVVARAFDPFFTTKPVGKGTGLGLSQVYGITRQSGGDVAIESEVGKGTTVILRLPRATYNASPEPSDAVAPTPHRNSERLLLVDDDADVREFVRMVLSELGFEVTEASNGQSALAILREFKPHLLIVDFAMPGMSGVEFALRARASSPGLSFLFVSGYIDPAEIESAVGRAPLLKKPFGAEELVAAVRKTLDDNRENSIR